MLEINQFIKTINASLYRLIRNTYTDDTATNDINDILNKNNNSTNNNDNKYINTMNTGKKPLYQVNNTINKTTTTTSTKTATKTASKTKTTIITTTINVNPNPNANASSSIASTHVKSYAPYIVAGSLLVGILSFLILTATIITYIQKKNREVIF